MVGPDAISGSEREGMTAVRVRHEASFLPAELTEEAQRQLNICNACRYCEGLCAVFPALERRLGFDEPDILFLANLCHDCRSCNDACPYALPHVFAVSIPPLMSQLREETYRSFTVPGRLASLSASWTTILLTALVVMVIVAGSWIGVGSDVFFGVHEGPGAFFAVVPFVAMLLPALAIAGFALVVMLLGARRFSNVINASAVNSDRARGRRTLIDILSFRNMRGGGPGCTYAEEGLGENLSQSRRFAHALVFYGFGLGLVATTLAAIYQDILGIMPPYEVFSLPVILGTIGGGMMTIGCSMMLRQKAGSGVSLETPKMKSMDRTFIILLLAANISGLLLLLFRASPLMGLSLTIHLGLVLALFATLPYGKFVHSTYRSIALYRNESESLTR